ncbi:class I SAM-dependent methyltransferase [Planctomycetales bacterium ZRK34]|nr:class I SAM-dependent methyltransferase [Planctomycetales bacterium ZRK34]
MKSTVDEIRARFDADVERFSNLETGQVAAQDSAKCMAMIARAAAAVCPEGRDLLDIGCGAGNYSLMLLKQRPGVNVTLVDLSRPMLDRAQQRVGEATAGSVNTLQGDVREVDLGAGRYDWILAAAVLHHLRSDAEWVDVFTRLHAALRPGGSLWIYDMVEHESAPVGTMMQSDYGDYLVSLKDAAYRDHVFDYIQQEDTPRPLTFQMELMRSVGFTNIDVLHKNTCFAAFGGIRTA